MKISLICKVRGWERQPISAKTALAPLPSTMSEEPQLATPLPKVAGQLYTVDLRAGPSRTMNEGLLTAIAA
ncbi:MAG: hypothetical protein ACRYFW_11870 [Janthinobacterium lividum]